MFTVVTLSGPSASGKSTIKNSLDFLHITTATTRSPRGSEVDGKDYHFKRLGEFWSLYLMGEILEKNFFEGNFYGMYRESLEKVKLSNSVYAVVCESNGVNFLTQYFGKDHILPIFITLPLETVERRLRERSLSEQGFQERFERAKYELSSEYMSLWEGEGHIVYNGDVSLTETVRNIKEIVRLKRNEP